MARVALPIAGAVLGSFFGPVGSQIGFALGSMIAGSMERTTIQGPAIGEIAQQTSQEGTPVPIVFGMSPPIAGNIIYAAEPNVVLRQQTRNGVRTRWEEVYRTYAIGVCEGPIDGFLRVWRNGILVYDVSENSQLSTADNNLFLQKATFYLGAFDQAADPDIDAIASPAPAHRGTAYMVIADEDLTELRGAIPQYTFQVQRGGVVPEPPPPEVWAGDLYVWGSEANGMLGLGATSNRSSPVLLSGRRYRNVYTSRSGAGLSFAIDEDGYLWAWGQNLSGALGLGDTVNRSSPVQVGAHRWRMVAISSNADVAHTLAIREDGTLWAWGDNTNGKLGVGDTTDRSSPVLVSAESWLQVACHGNSSMGLRHDGIVFEWGSVRGTGSDLSARSSPVAIVGGISFVQIDQNGSVGAGISVTGALWTWGLGMNGRLGNGSTATVSTPVLVLGGYSWSQVSLGGGNNGGITHDGRLFTWGATQTGTGLGDGSGSSRSSPVQLAGASYVQVKMGTSNSHAIRTDGTLWAWGYNSEGWLGDGTTVSRPSMVQIGANSWRMISGSNAGQFLSGHNLALRRDDA